ncbi:MAG: hypothetical protein KBT07_06230 [Clostridiales bacterium]|nr:hypothetical protein [Candidatus Scatonaster coprocaballi]
MDEKTQDSRMIRIFGHSKLCMDKGKMSINTADEKCIICNGNYIDGERYIINTGDPYAQMIVGNRVRQMPVLFQNPDVYLKLFELGILIAVPGLILCGTYNDYSRVGRLLPGNGKLRVGLGLILLIIGAVLFLAGISIFFLISKYYSRQMRECASEICAHYYELHQQKLLEKDLDKDEDKEDEEDTQFEFYASCPECGAVRFGNYDTCRKCGHSLRRE